MFVVNLIFTKMKKHLILICMIGLGLVMFGQKANAVTLTVTSFSVTFTDKNPCPGVVYTIDWRIVLTSPFWVSNWEQGTMVYAPGTYTGFGGISILSAPEPNTGAYYRLEVRIKKDCGGGRISYAYGYADFLDYGTDYILYPDPNDIPVGF
jgi:hypothetical protein